MIETQRLLLRPFIDDDVDELHRLYTDPEVMRFIPPARTRADTENWLRRHQALRAQHGFDIWAAVLKAEERLIGRIGLMAHDDWDADTKIEVGWLLDKSYWGRGLATEGGLASLRYGFDDLRLDRIISITRPENVASRRVMERLRLTYVGATFWHGHDQIWYAADRGTWCPRS